MVGSDPFIQIKFTSKRTAKLKESNSIGGASPIETEQDSVVIVILLEGPYVAMDRPASSSILAASEQTHILQHWVDRPVRNTGIGEEYLKFPAVVWCPNHTT